MYKFLENYERRMKELSGPKIDTLKAEHATVSMSEQLLDYASRIGMIHLNKSTYSRSVCDVWDYSKGDVPIWAILENKQLFYCKALVGARTTYPTPEVAASLVAVAGDRFAPLSDELRQAYDTIRLEGPLTRRGMSELLGYSAEEGRKIHERLVKQLLITVFETEPPVGRNWPELTFWTVDEWLLNHRVDATKLRPTKKHEKKVVAAAAKCMISVDSAELATALRWSTAKVKVCLEQFSPTELKELTEPIRPCE